MTLRRRQHAARPARGFTLLEVILALGILAGALAVLGEVSRLSNRHAQASALESRAALVAESVMAELEAGTAQLVNFSGEWVDTENNQTRPEWTYEVFVQQTNTQGLLEARVTVEEISPGTDRPVRFQLVRWFQDPEYLATVQSNAASATSAASSTSGAASGGGAGM